jgi:hypothetical protein
MKVTALIAAAALAVGTAAYAQQQDNAKTDEQPHATAGQKVRNAMHKLGEKTRHALHRDHANNTRAMGGPGTGATSRDAAAARQARMDDAYANWQRKQNKEASR